MARAGTDDRLNLLDAYRKDDGVRQLARVMRFVVTVVLAHGGRGQQPIADCLPQVVDERIGERGGCHRSSLHARVRKDPERHRIGGPAWGRRASQSSPSHEAIVAATWLVWTGGRSRHSPRADIEGDTNAIQTFWAPST
jgi:hypothetical protein